MGTDPKGAVETLRRKLQDGDRGGCDEDRDLLLAFSDELQLLRQDYGHHRHVKLLRHNVRISEHADVCLHDSVIENADDAPDDVFHAAKDTAKEAVRWIHDTYDIEDGSQETNRDYRVAFRLLAKHTTRGDDIPETHDWISTNTSRDYQPEPDEAKMLKKDEHVDPMVEAARNPRDAALIALQFEGGFRGGELFDLRVRDITDGVHGLKVRVDGKRGEHDVHLIQSVPYVKRWLTEHPGVTSDHVWSDLNEASRISYQRYLQCFRESAARADVNIPVTPTNFRKSNAYWLAMQGKSQAFIEDRQGRARGSPVISRYVAKFSGETQEKQYAAMHGIDVDAKELEKPTPPVPCPRCEQETPPDVDFCIHCNQALDLEAKKAVDDALETIDEAVVAADDADDRSRLLDASRSIRDKPHLVDVDRLHEVVPSSELSDED